VKIRWSEKKSVSNVYIWSVNSTIICKHWKNTYAHEHIALLSYKSCTNFRMVRPQRKLPTWWQFQDMCPVSALTGWNLSRRFAAVRRPPTTGVIANCNGHFANSSVPQRQVTSSHINSNAQLNPSRVPKATLGQGIRLSGTWLFFLRLEPHIIWRSLCS
jgi:hypothetical protein